MANGGHLYSLYIPTGYSKSEENSNGSLVGCR